jgi:hypothetical protein
MKKFTVAIAITLLSSAVFAQSKSYSLLKEKFSGHENVVSFRTSGFLTRSVLLFAGEPEYNRAIKQVRKIRITVIPKAAFKAEKVTVKGFIKIAKKDSFEELFSAYDHGDEVTLLVQSEKDHPDNRYLLLVDGNDEVVALEITGYIDHKLLLKKMKSGYNHQEI